MMQKVLNCVFKSFSSALETAFYILTASFSDERSYSYTIESISVDSVTYKAVIEYRSVGSRRIRKESALLLNQSDLFSMFKPEHAQMIVTIATIEALLNKDVLVLKDTHTSYIRQCADVLSSQG